MATVKDFSVEEKLVSLVALQKIESKIDEFQILKGELPMEVSDLEDEIQGLNARQTRIEEEINGINEFIYIGIILIFIVSYFDIKTIKNDIF